MTDDGYSKYGPERDVPVKSLPPGMDMVTVGEILRSTGVSINDASRNVRLFQMMLKRKRRQRPDEEN